MAEGTRTLKEAPTLELVLKRNPVERLKRHLVAGGLWSDDEHGRLQKEIEDETGITNGLIWARDFEANRRDVMAARLMVLESPW